MAVFTAALRACNDAFAPLSRHISVHGRGLFPVSAPRRCNSRSALAFSRVRALYSLTNACSSAASASVNVPSLFLVCSNAKRSCTSNGKQYAAAARSSWMAMITDDIVPDIVQFLSETGRVTALMIPCKVWCVKHAILYSEPFSSLGGGEKPAWFPWERGPLPALEAGEMSAAPRSIHD
jgi:hypothetical protein